jgi:hypothetical protein
VSGKREAAKAADKAELSAQAVEVLKALKDRGESLAVDLCKKVRKRKEETDLKRQRRVGSVLNQLKGRELVAVSGSPTAHGPKRWKITAKGSKAIS